MPFKKFGGDEAKRKLMKVRNPRGKKRGGKKRIKDRKWQYT